MMMSVQRSVETPAETVIKQLGLHVTSALHQCLRRCMTVQSSATFSSCLSQSEALVHDDDVSKPVVLGISGWR